MPDPRPETLDREALRSHGDESPGSLARALRYARKHQGQTLREVERATEIPNAHVSQIERGTIKKPEPETVVRLAQFFGLNEVLLLRWAGHDWFADKLAALLAAEQRAAELESKLAALTKDPVSWREGTFRLRMEQAEQRAEEAVRERDEIERDRDNWQSIAWGRHTKLQTFREDAIALLSWVGALLPLNGEPRRRVEAFIKAALAPHKAAEEEKGD